MRARWPMAIHVTFQYGDMPDYAFGKRQRFCDLSATGACGSSTTSRVHELDHG
jgi:hypothetical protein